MKPKRPLPQNSVPAGVETPAASEAPTIVLGEVGAPGEFAATEDGASHEASVVGSTLLGRYRVVELIGRGGMSRVYKALDLEAPGDSVERFLALKVLIRPFLEPAESFRSLQLEVHRLRALNHPNIVRLLGCDRDGAVVFMTMEYLLGHSLHARFRAGSPAAAAPVAIDRGEALTIISAIAAALEFAHASQIVHGDLKPGNVFITDTGEIKVIDFSIANWIARPQTALERREAAQNRVASAVTPRYASPQLMARQKPDATDDVYSLACLAYELLTGNHPFDGATGAQAIHFPPPPHPELTAPQYAAILQGLQLERRDRTASIRRFIDEFTQRPRRKGWTKAVLGLCAVLLLAVGAWYGLHPSASPEAPAIAVTPAAPQPAPAATPSVASGTVIQDCPNCPAVTVLPAGRYVQGNDETASSSVEKPQHAVIIAAPFALSTDDVTVANFAEFVAATARDMRGCDTYDGRWRHRATASWKSPGFAQEATHPVTCTSWSDAKAYAAWLSARTGHAYRLPSAAEWEYAARAGAVTRPWEANGSTACANANVADQSAVRRYPGWNGFSCDDGYVYTSPVGAFGSNALGLHDMLGNVFQWTEDCWHENYGGSPTDGSARLDGDCTQHELRGGSWFSSPAYVRASYRNHFPASYRTSSVGFRVVRELE